MTVFTETFLLKGKLSAGQFSHQILPVSVFTIKPVSTTINRKETCNMLPSFHCDKFCFFFFWLCHKAYGPDMFAEFSRPYIKEVIKDVNAHDSSAPTFVHICGRTLDILEQMPDTGADCLSFDHAVNPAKAKEVAGKKIAIMGNVDPVEIMMMGNPEIITKACYDVIDAAGQDSGFILAPGCETPITTSDENILAMCNAARTYWTR